MSHKLWVQGRRLPWRADKPTALIWLSLLCLQASIYFQIQQTVKLHILELCVSGLLTNISPISTLLLPVFQSPTAPGKKYLGLSLSRCSTFFSNYANLTCSLVLGRKQRLKKMPSAVVENSMMRMGRLNQTEMPIHYFLEFQRLSPAHKMEGCLLIHASYLTGVDWITSVKAWPP